MKKNVTNELARSASAPKRANRSTWLAPLIGLVFLLSGLGVNGQIVSDGLNNSTTLFTLAGGAYYTGNSAAVDGPSSSPFASEGTHSRGVSNATATLTSNDINTSSYTGIQLSLRVASFSLGSAGNGADVGDIVTIEISPDGGATYYSTLRILGNGNAYWAYTATGLASTAYDGDVTPVNFQPAGGGVRTTDGYSTINITSLPVSTNMRIRITMVNNSANERWVVDDVIVTGTAAGCSISLSSAVGTNAQTVCANSPISNITYATSIATGATFSGLPSGVTGSWAANVATITGTPTVAGTYNYTVTLTGGGCSNTANGTITVNAVPAEPAGTITPGANPACGSTTLTYSGAAATIYWQTTATGTSTANPTTTPLTVTSSGTYYVRTYNGSCWSTNSLASAAITINAAQSITTQPANQTINEPNTATFSVVASNATGYQWQISTDGGGSWSDISGATASSYTTGATTTAMTGYQYHCIVSGTAPCTAVTSNAGILTVNAPSASCATDLIISEYIEGNSNEKYIEIYNGTGAAIDLSDYRLQLYSNGSPTTSSDVVLSGILADGAVMVYRNSSALLYPAATSNAACGFNGDDAVALYKTSTSSYVDIIGRIGEDPGTAWTGGGLSTLDKTLVRNLNVFGGVTTNPGAGFPTLATEWTQYNIDDVSHLGSHTMTCFSNTITTGTVSAPPFTVTCAAGASGTVTFTSTDAFTGNTYTAQLSNASGSFASSFNIGTLVSDANSGTINITIPAGLPTGAGYLIRVISSSPAVVGSVSAAFTITLSGGPCSCFEIESILVDACDAGNEGRNEMFRFAVGGTPINTSDITVTWPNVANLWQGICQNGTTASIVSNINATIVAGGSLVEPVGGVIPAGSEVMFFTNTNFNYAMFDFSTLNYTLVAIFQCPDNTPGHFVNYTTPGPVLRTLDMTVAGCGSDAVTYDASLLYNGDGATVDFDVPGNPTYSATGNCTTVPIFPVPIELMFFKTTCNNDGVTLNWATSSETNNSFFAIESSDGLDDFSPIGIVNGAGNSNQVVQYSYFDNDISKYYRLKQADFDGAYTYSTIQATDCESGEIQLFPSVVQLGDPIFIVGEVDDIMIVDVMGNVINSQLLDNTITGLSSGMYFIVINNRWPFKIIVE